MLATAVRSNDLEELLICLEKIRRLYPITFMQFDGEWNTTIHIAVALNCLPIFLRVLLREENRLYVGSLEDRDRNHNTALHICAKDRNIELAEILLKKGADVNPIDFLGMTPLHLAAGNPWIHAYYGIIQLHRARHPQQKLHMINLLLDYNADIDTRDPRGETALYLGVKCGHLDVVRLLLERGADISLDTKRTPMVHNAITRRTRDLTDENTGTEMLELLLDHGCDIDTIDDKNRDVSDRAIHMGNRYADRLIARIRAEIPNQLDSLAATTIEKRNTAIMMSHNHRLGMDACLQAIPIDIIMNILQEQESHDVPGNIVSASLRTLRGHHGRISILDTDYQYPDLGSWLSGYWFPLLRSLRDGDPTQDDLY
jgi:hypothetical protein